MADTNLLNGSDNVSLFLKAVPVLFLLVTIGASFAVAKSKIDENSKSLESQGNEINKLKKNKEQMIRFEERQKYIQADVREIKQILKRRQ